MILTALPTPASRALAEAENLDDQARVRARNDQHFRARLDASLHAVNLTYLPGSVPVGAIALALHISDRARLALHPRTLTG